MNPNQNFERAVWGTHLLTRLKTSVCIGLGKPLALSGPISR